jgi:hypothetical protein
MQQYLKAIKSVEPSQIIRKFLDTQQIHNLIDFLEELHEQKRANADHTTLLLNCYAKLKDVDKLEKFIKSPGDLKFDPDTAIQMCRQGQYFEQAVYLAQKNDAHDLVVEILVEDSQKPEEALNYISRLEAPVMYRNLVKNARALLEACPEPTTKLFIDFFTKRYRPDEQFKLRVTPPQPQNGQSTAVQNLAALLPLPYVMTSASTPASELDMRLQQRDGQSATPKSTISIPEYEPPKPRVVFSCFVDNPDQFIEFLEACLADSRFHADDRADLYTTLLEMYLHNAQGKKGDEKEKWEKQAKSLIDDRKVC